jgi:hypothetical protein
MAGVELRQRRIGSLSKVGEGVMLRRLLKRRIDAMEKHLQIIPAKLVT